MHDGCLYHSDLLKQQTILAKGIGVDPESRAKLVAAETLREEKIAKIRMAEKKI